MPILGEIAAVLIIQPIHIPFDIPDSLLAEGERFDDLVQDHEVTLGQGQANAVASQGGVDLQIPKTKVRLVQFPKLIGHPLPGLVQPPGPVEDLDEMDAGDRAVPELIMPAVTMETL